MATRFVTALQLGKRMIVRGCILAAMLLAGVNMGTHPPSVRARTPLPPHTAPAPAVTGAAHTPDAVIQSCYGSAESFWQSFVANTLTQWHYRTTTANCADLNVAITDAPSGCVFFVDAQYYKRSTGQWIDGANDDYWFNPGYWSTPLTALLDNTQIRVRFKSNCTTTAGVWLAY